ncbi:hypothetical protein [Paenibacillus sp. RC343]|uniref:hypothetical protein n=1 Tax=Paenibacillus sp. RC343 TaxID=3045841 RepID=UPI0024B92AD8|nr:hypothetical protein [Paenibacillus sp. RC343]
MNPFFIDNLKSFGENLFKSGELQEKITLNLDSLEQFFLKENSEYQLKKIEGTKSFMKEDVDILLNEIFPRTERN